MSKCTLKKILFPSLKKRKVVAAFNGKSITNDGGILLLRQAENKIGLLKKIAAIIPEYRNKPQITHSREKMVMQRVFGIALGYPDLNDHNILRNDLAFQTGVNSDSALASSPTLCRLENQASEQIAWNAHKIMFDHFVASYKETPEELILDFDATDDLVHGNQIGKHYHGYYGDYCFLPLYVTCDNHLLVSYLRPSNKDGARNAWAILALLVRNLRQVWATVKIIFRGDSGFCRHQMFDWCEKNNVFYITGLGGNPRVKGMLAPAMKIAEDAFHASNEKQRVFDEFNYSAESWSKERRVIGKAEHTADGANPRFIVTNLSDGDPQFLYDQVYCARGEMENRIKEQKNDLNSDRTSCHKWWPNQLRLIFSSLAYILVEYLRTHALKDTDFEAAQVSTIRSKLLKVGATIIRNTRRIVFSFPSNYLYKAVFEHAVEILSSA